MKSSLIEHTYDIHNLQLHVVQLILLLYSKRGPKVQRNQGGRVDGHSAAKIVTRNPEDMTLIGPDGNEVKVKRHHIDGNEVVMTAYTKLIDKNYNTEFKLTFGGNTYTGSFHPTEKQIIMDIPNSKYMIKMFVEEE